MEEENKNGNVAEEKKETNGFLDEIRPQLGAIMEIAKRYRGEGKTATVIVCAGYEKAHSMLLHGTGGDLRELLVECFTDDKSCERILMAAARNIAIKGIADAISGGVSPDPKLPNEERTKEG